MKIAVITIHWANNYGASLQTYATIKALESFGEVTLLDYRTPHVAKGMQLLRLGTKPRDFLRFSKDLFRILPRHRVINKFKKFTQSMPLSPPLRNASDFEQQASLHDVFICGSDQIWNPHILGESGHIDSRFMLDFAKEKQKISYASSMGTYRYSTEQIDQVKRLLGEFNAISVREKDTADYLTTLLDKPVQSVLDPTLLHDRNEWLNFFNIKETEPDQPFILVYALKKDTLLKQAVDHYRNKLNIKVVAIDQDPFINFKTDQHIRDASPNQFVKLFAQASFIITNSFHGTCFSTIFNKNFVATTPPSGANRITNLLRHTKLTNRLINNIEELSNISVEIDFSYANAALEAARNESLDFIKNSIKLP